MAQGYDFDYSLTDAQKDHFNALREARGWSWETLADELDKEIYDPATPALAKWARAQANAEAKPARARRATERATESAPEKR